MSGGVFGAIKNGILILEEMNRLKDNIKKILDRVEELEKRLDKIDTGNQISAVRDEALIAKFEAATKAASAETHARLIERIVRLEMTIEADAGVHPKRIGPSE